MNSGAKEDTDASNTIFLSGPASLARILDEDKPDAAVWKPQEMSAMWQHQLRAPFEEDLATVRSRAVHAFQNSPEAASYKNKSFAEVLHGSKVPLVLLKALKDLAKQMLKEAEDAQLKEIAAALYYASYAVAMIQHGQKLGGMSEHELRGGFEWAIGRVWLDETTAMMIRQALEVLAR